MPATPFHTEGMDEGRNPDSRRGRRGRGRRRPRRERRVRGSSALPMITLVAPIAAQALMVIMLLLERRWLFAAMVAPGMVGCMASAASSLADRRGSSRRDESGTTSHDAAGGRPSRPTDMAGARGRHHGSADGADRDKDEGDESEDPSRIHSPSLEELTGLQAEPLPWRIIARTWLVSPSLCVTVGMGVGAAAVHDRSAPPRAARLGRRHHGLRQIRAVAKLVPGHGGAQSARPAAFRVPGFQGRFGVQRHRAAAHIPWAACATSSESRCSRVEGAGAGAATQGARSPRSVSARSGSCNPRHPR